MFGIARFEVEVAAPPVQVVKGACMHERSLDAHLLIEAAEPPHTGHSWSPAQPPQGSP